MRSLVLACLILIWPLAIPAAAAPRDFGQGTHIGRYAGLPALPANLHRLYAEFRHEAGYFAAMAVNFEAGGGFYIQNFHDLSRARTAALEGCKQLYGATGCTVYAVALPASLPVSQTHAAGLSGLAAADFNSRYSAQRRPGTYAAFAVSGASHHGFGTDYATETDARDTAIAYCTAAVARDMADLGPQARRFARARGWDHCEVVDVQHTPD